MSLFILCVIEIYHRIINVYIDGVIKESGIYKDDSWYIIPTIKISKSDKYFELVVEFLCFRYYSAYHIDKDEEK